MCTINICFSFSIFSIFYQKIIFHDIQCYVQCDNVYSTFVNGKNLHVNIVTYSDVYNKHLFYMFKHVLTHYLLWYGPPVVVIQRFFLLLQHRCTFLVLFLCWERPFTNFTMDVKKLVVGHFLIFQIDQKLFLTFYRLKIKKISRFFIGHEPDIRGTAFQFSENQTATPVWKILSFTRLNVEKKP